MTSYTQDLAARNVLVGDGEICKVADFGLLRELPEDDAIYVSSSNVPCPIRWMPPEAIKRKFSVASDVWSFGILQWEMMNPGKLPYANFANLEVRERERERGRDVIFLLVQLKFWSVSIFFKSSARLPI